MAKERSRFFLCMFLALRIAGLSAGDARAGAPAAAVFPENSPETQTIVSLKRISQPGFHPESRILSGYYHPLALRQTYSRDQAGPDGYLGLPDRRQFQSRLNFTVYIGDDKRALVPEVRGASLTVYFSPGKIREEWVWPDGLALTRICFQPVNFPGVGIRFALRNGSAATLGGLRLEARFINPEISELRPAGADGSSGEEDDELITDPRSGTLFQHDWMAREATWLGIGWSPEGGPIMAAEEEGPQGNGYAVVVRLETPAQDLAPQQAMSPIFWMAWGNDRDSAARSLDKLRKYSGFPHWEEDVKNANQSGMDFRCQDPHITYLFQSLKAWTRWSSRLDAYGREGLMNIAGVEWVLPEQASSGSTGLIMFLKPAILQGYLTYWLEQKTPTPNSAHSLIMAGMYFQQTLDRKWLAENIGRILEMVHYLQALDQNHDGLPEFIYPADPSLDALFQVDESAVPMQTAAAEVSAVRAFRLAADLAEQAGGQASAQAVPLRQQAERAMRSFQAHYWEPRIGPQGYYSYGRWLEQGMIDRHRNIGAIENVLFTVGSPESLNAVFNDLWHLPGWRTPKGRYRIVPVEEPAYQHRMREGLAVVSFSRTHQVLLSGLVQPATATEAVQRLSGYAREMALDPKVLAQPGSVSERPGDLDISALNYMDVIVQGLCGLESDSRGLRVRVPAYSQALEAEVRQMPYRGSIINVRVNGSGGGRARVTVNGRPLAPGAYIPVEAFNKGRVSIRIDREPKREPSRIQKRSPNVIRKKP